MARIDFKHFPVYTSVNRKDKKVADARETFADLLYKSVNGIRSHALALKIFQSEGNTDFSADEVALIRRTAETYCLPGFIDGLYEQLETNKKEE